MYAMYRSPSSSIENFVYGLDRYLHGNECISNYNIFISDINIDIYNHVVDMSVSKSTIGFANEYLNVLYSHGFRSYINDVTREESGSHSCVDHKFIRSLKNDSDMVLPCLIR